MDDIVNAEEFFIPENSSISIIKNNKEETSVKRIARHFKIDEQKVLYNYCVENVKSLFMHIIRTIPVLTAKYVYEGGGEFNEMNTTIIDF